MPIPVTIPQVTISMEEGTIVYWLKAPGDVVAEGEPLFEMETDKANLEVPSPAAGVLLRTLVSNGTAKVNDVVAWIGEPGEVLDETPAAKPAETALQAPAKIPQIPAEADVAPQHIIASPAARRRGKELGIDLASVTGTGQGGRITEQDVEHVAQAGPSPASRRAIARQLSLAWREAPHIHIGRELDAAGLAAVREKLQSVSYTDLFLYAVAKVLPSFPQLTQVWDGERLQQGTGIDVCLAVETPKGVVAPVIRSADKLSFHDLRRRQRQITEAARAGRLKVDELQGVFTLTNLGMYGADFFTPILNHPQTAILATGRVMQQPVINSGTVGVGWRIWVNVAVDHRVTDGAYAARFLEEFQQMLNRLPREAEVTV
jgi:pyruvate dehydrogenase E2 component (dihydrolipoamide acetyltransferase)